MGGCFVGWLVGGDVVEYVFSFGWLVFVRLLVGLGMFACVGSVLCGVWVVGLFVSVLLFLVFLVSRCRLYLCFLLRLVLV